MISQDCIPKIHNFWNNRFMAGIDHEDDHDSAPDNIWIALAQIEYTTPKTIHISWYKQY